MLTGKPYGNYLKNWKKDIILFVKGLKGFGCIDPEEEIRVVRTENAMKEINDCYKNNKSKERVLTILKLHALDKSSAIQKYRIMGIFPRLSYGYIPPE